MSDDRRDSIIASMCMTWDHSFGLMSGDEQDALWRQMDQIYVHDIEPVFTTLTAENAELERQLAEVVSEVGAQNIALQNITATSQKALSKLASLRALNVELVEALAPFATAARNFSFAIGPDGMDDGYVVTASTAARSEYEAMLGTTDFSRAAAALAKAKAGL